MSFIDDVGDEEELRISGPLYEYYVFNPNHKNTGSVLKEAEM